MPVPDEALWDDLAALAEPGHHYLLPSQVMRRRRPPERKSFVRLHALLTEAGAAAASIQDQSCMRELETTVAAITDARALLERAVEIASVQIRRTPDHPMGDHAMHDWWYRRLAHAGIVAKGVTHGERLHKARHTAGQRVLDATGNLKAAQKLLGHATIDTTGDSYTDWDDDQLAATLLTVVKGSA